MLQITSFNVFTIIIASICSNVIYAMDNNVNYCPEVNTIPSPLTDGQKMEDHNESWRVSIPGSGKIIVKIINSDLSFNWATTQKTPHGKISCVYKINSNKVPYYITLYSHSALMKDPIGGAWKAEHPGLCQSQNGVPTYIKDCPFFLENSRSANR